MMDVYVGLDVGTTHIKAVAVDAHLKILAMDHVKTPVCSDELGDLHDADAIRHAARQVVRTVSESLPRDTLIRAIAVASMGEEGFLLDDEDHVLVPSVAWYEQRTSALAERWMAEHGPVATQQVGLPLKLNYSLFKWLWLKEFHRDTWNRGRTWLPISEFIAFALSGQKSISPSQAARTFAFDVRRAQWISQTLEDSVATGVAAMPPIHRSGMILGPVENRGQEWGLPSNTLVVVGGHDHPLGAFGAGVKGSNRILDSMGTAELMYWPQATIPTIELPPGFEWGYTQFETPYYLGAVTYTGLILNTLSRWLHFPVMNLDTGGSDSRATGAPWLLPNILGDRASFELRQLEPRHTPTDILRAAYEASGMVLKSSYERIRQWLPSSDPVQWIAIGGGSSSRTALRIKATIFNHPLYVYAGVESVATGVAKLACQAILGTDVEDPLEETNLLLIEPEASLVPYYADRYEQFIRAWTATP